MKIGLKEIVITPDFPALLAGFPTPLDRYAKRIHDDLYAHCFYFESKGEECVIITLDILNLHKYQVKAIREKINQFTGVPTERILISATHTHSAPVPGAVPSYREAELQYDDMYPHYIGEITHRIALTIKQIKEQAFEAKIGVGKAYCGKEQGVGGNRHIKDGLVDPYVYVVAIKDMEDNLRGVITRYSLHPTFLHAESRDITADYPGYIYEYFRTRYPGCVPAFQIGTAGDQSSRFFRTGTTYEEAKRVGTTIASEADKMLQSMEFCTDPVISLFATDVEPIYKDIPPVEQAKDELEKEKKALQDAIDNNEPQGVIRSHECAVIGAERMYTWAAAGRENFYGVNCNHPLEIQLLLIGEIAFVGVPTETFVTYGLEIQEKSPFKNTIVVCCANGYGRGYIVTPEALAEGGYEALGTAYNPKTGSVIVNAALEILEKAYNKLK